jgi:aldehyde dehydrogenase (NAD+)
MKRLISAGGICINDTLVHLGNLELPFGGIGHSGMGSYHGYESFKTFTHFKAIERKSLKGDLALRYPPYRMKLTSFLKKWI